MGKGRCDEKVYIVTSGVYSDYRIEAVFSNREAAEKYASIVPDANEVEERKVYDHVGRIFTVISLWMKFDKSGTPIGREGCEPFHYISVVRKSTNVDSLEEVNETIYRERVHLLILSRSVDKEELLDEELARLKEEYEKLMVELYSQIKILVEKGWTEEKVNEWLKDKTRREKWEKKE